MGIPFSYKISYVNYICLQGYRWEFHIPAKEEDENYWP
jgi:hypothetical protein